jgi:hypothetical protein
MAEEPSRKETLVYIEGALREMIQMARNLNLPTLVYMLDMARIEVEDSLNQTRGAKRS